MSVDPVPKKPDVKTSSPQKRPSNVISLSAPFKTKYGAVNAALRRFLAERGLL